MPAVQEWGAVAVAGDPGISWEQSVVSHMLHREDVALWDTCRCSCTAGYKPSAELLKIRGDPPLHRRDCIQHRQLSFPPGYDG